MSSFDPVLYQLIRDPSFARWVHRTDAEAVAYWEAWTVAHPEHTEAVEVASRMVKGITFAPRGVPDQQIEQQWAQLQQRLAASNRLTRPSRWLPGLRAAAVGAVVVMAGLLAWWLTAVPTDTLLTYTTRYGETREIALPDGSHVVLNANSRLSYQAATVASPVRRVHLTGEAFFDVMHEEGDRATPFLVHTPDLDVKVIGTEFNVNTRRNRTQVVLDEGQVELQRPTKERALMQPGELVEYQTDANQVRRASVDIELFTAWRDRQLKFDDTPLGEVAQLLEENYGVRIQFESEHLRSKRVTGEVSARELDTIGRAVSRLVDIAIQRSRETIHISSLHVSP